jgi:hypothetical protein
MFLANQILKMKMALLKKKFSAIQLVVSEIKLLLNRNLSVCLSKSVGIESFKAVKNLTNLVQTVRNQMIVNIQIIHQ